MTLPDSHTVLLFAVAAAALVSAPGPATLYIVTRSLDGGRRAGMASVLGINTGALVHIGAAALGLSALLASSALAFNAVKYAGAAYLVYLGVRKLLSKERVSIEGQVEPQTLARTFYQGIVVNVLNPKAALFFFAFLPQFVDVNAPGAALQILFLGAVFIAIAFIGDSTYALLAGAVRGLLKRSEAFSKTQKYLTGGIYILLGLGAAFAGSSKLK